MRLHYYQFPEGIDAPTRHLHGADRTSCICDVSGTGSQACSFFDGNVGCLDCSYYHVQEAEDMIEGISLSSAKRLLRKFGGHAWTQHIERDGCVFETTSIHISGNNSKVKYNHHL